MLQLPESQFIRIFYRFYFSLIYFIQGIQSSLGMLRFHRSKFRTSPEIVAGQKYTFFTEWCKLLQNGVLLRTVLDRITGDLSDTRTRYLGTREVKLFKVKMQGKNAV